ncbi:hypothetical protein GCM10009678_82870 [Actinomadura kijaniata]|uniref:Uncharacterized protein n=1 Tax=Actinomadura namibiensis TaxID=182080 RepID=A0A7W3LZY9_ACTNM|nr:hypothetical protein [Actinomadura namibiensis]MBA8957455.1 hypothetical protein [Actinomadura namibiensis]
MTDKARIASAPLPWWRGIDLGHGLHETRQVCGVAQAATASATTGQPTDPEGDATLFGPNALLWLRQPKRRTGSVGADALTRWWLGWANGLLKNWPS